MELAKSQVNFFFFNDNIHFLPPTLFAVKMHGNTSLGEMLAISFMIHFAITEASFPCWLLGMVPWRNTWQPSVLSCLAPSG